MKENVKHIFVALLLGLSIPCSANDHGLKKSLTVANASIRPMPPGQSNTAAYLTIKNHSDRACTLLSVDSPVVERIEFHTHLHEQGMVKMRPIKTLNLPARGSLTFESGGLHLMLFGAETILENHNGTQINIHTDHCGSISFYASVADSIVNSRQDMHH